MWPRIVDAGLEARPPLELLGQPRRRSRPAGRGRIGRPAAPDVAQPGGLGVGALRRDGALGDDHDRRELPTGVAPLQPLAHVVDVEGDLGHEDLGRAPGDPGVGGDPSDVATHDLAHDDPVMGLGRGAQPVDGVGGDLHGGVEPEGHLGPRQVVVDGLRDPHGVDAVGPEAVGHAQGVLAPDGHQRVDAAGAEGGEHPLGPALDGEGVGARRPQDGPAQRQDVAAPRGRRERRRRRRARPSTRRGTR